MFLIKVEPIPKRGTYRLAESVIIEGRLIEKGFEYNGASIPAFAWPIIGSPFDPCFMAPALYHDHGYAKGDKPRKVLDKTFKKLLIHNCVDKERAETMYSAVRAFGWPFYNRNGMVTV